MTNNNIDNNSFSSSFAGSINSRKSLLLRLKDSYRKPQEHVLQGINPRRVYQAIWCRDASYILKEWFLSGNIQGVMQRIYLIWCHQLSTNKEKVIYVQGSPVRDFLPEVARLDKEREFDGALPTTINQAGFS
jgi:hypothetical protein